MVAERFFNIWYLMRASRRVRRRLEWLVRFLEIFYGRAGVQDRAEKLLGAGSGERRGELALAYARSVEDPGLIRALEDFGLD